MPQAIADAPPEPRALPNDPIAERALLGAAMLQGPGAQVLAETLDPADFYLPAHQRIAAAIISLYRDGSGTDPRLVDGKLGSRTSEPLVDLVELQVEAPSTSNAASFAARVLRAAYYRKLLYSVGDLTDAAYRGDDDRTAAALERLDQVRNTSGADDLPLSQLRRHLMSGDQIRNLPPLEPLISGVLDMNTLSVLYGASGAGKTFVSLDWALSVATGSWWQRRQTRPGKVLYVVAEGATGVWPRVEAWQQCQQVFTTGNLQWLPMAVNMFQPAWATALASLVKEQEPALVVLDTLARSMIGADENSARDMGVVVAGCDQVRQACGSAVLLVHHTGKVEANGMRGNSALQAALETAWELREGDDGCHELRNEKQKNGPDGQLIRIRLQAVKDSLAVVEWRGAGSISMELTPAMLEVLTALRDVDPGPGVSSKVWQVSCKGPERSFYRWKKRLLDLALVVSAGGQRFRLSPAGVLAAAGEEWRTGPAAAAEYEDPGDF